jgi:hypothetical protein
MKMRGRRKHLHACTCCGGGRVTRAEEKKEVREEILDGLLEEPKPLSHLLWDLIGPYLDEDTHYLCSDSDSCFKWVKWRNEFDEAENALRRQIASDIESLITSPNVYSDWDHALRLAAKVARKEPLDE